MEKQNRYWLIKETYLSWNDRQFKEINYRMKPYHYTYDDNVQLLIGDIFLGLDAQCEFISTIGPVISNTYVISKKYRVHLQPRYYFKRMIPFLSIQQALIMDTKTEIFKSSSPFIPINPANWRKILQIIKEYDSTGDDFALSLEAYQQQKHYLDKIIYICNKQLCDPNERQEIFMILRNLLNWNPEYSEGRNELEEMFSFLRYSLHIEDLSYDKRMEILDTLISNWMKYVNFLPKKQIEVLQNIKEPFLL